MGCIRYISVLIVIIAVIFGVGLTYLQQLVGPNGLGYRTEAIDAVPLNASSELKGKNVILTGGYSGIGVDTARILASHGVNLWLPARNIESCEKIASNLRKSASNENIFCENLDLSSLQSVKNFANEWKKKKLPLHILINNAGIMAKPYSETVDGFESQFATNHLGHFLLTNLLWDNLKQGKPSRVISVSSGVHATMGINFDDLSGKNTWYNGTGFFTQYFGPIKAYGQSKTANILFAIELNERMKDFGLAVSLHPGVIATGLHRDSFLETVDEYTLFFRKPFMKTTSQGAATQVYLATALFEDLKPFGGKYFSHCNVEPAEPHATDPEIAKRLWTKSEELVKNFL